jgi:DUF3037 family protein
MASEPKSVVRKEDHMPSQYVVVQYVPDPIADERINVGVIAYDTNGGHAVRAQFLHEWSRVRRFGGEDIRFLKDFALSVQRAVGVQAAALAAGYEPKGEALDRQAIERMAKRWQESIQFTAPRGSLKSADNLLREAVQRFLSESVQIAEKRRDRQAAVNLARSRVRSAVKHLVGGEAAESLTKPNYELPGAKAQHAFDVAVANGVPYLAAHAVSLEGNESKQLLTQLDALAWMLDDTHALRTDLPLGVVMLPPREGSSQFERLDKIRVERTELYQALGAKVLREDEVESWAASALEPTLTALTRGQGAN